MATRGRKPLPTALKELEGDRGKGRRPLNKDEPTPPQDNVKCPAWLMPEAKKEWKRLAPSLIAMGVLTEHDMEAFAGYCQAYARWREAEEFLSQHGTIFKTPSGYVQQVPQVSIAMQNLKIIGVHGLPDRIRHIGRVDVAPQVQVHIGAEAGHMIVMMAGFCGGRGIDAILHGRILVGRCGPPDACVNRNADILERRVDLLHPLTPLAIEAFSPR